MRIVRVPVFGYTSRGRMEGALDINRDRFLGVEVLSLGDADPGSSSLQHTCMLLGSDTTYWFPTREEAEALRDRILAAVTSDRAEDPGPTPRGTGHPFWMWGEVK